MAGVVGTNDEITRNYFANTKVRIELLVGKIMFINCCLLLASLRTIKQLSNSFQVLNHLGSYHFP